MPTINIPPVVRFVLYLIAAVALLGVTYAVDKSWAGDAEVRFVTGLAALLQLLAAAKTNLRDAPHRDDAGASNPMLVFVAFCLLLFVLAVVIGVRT